MDIYLKNKPFKLFHDPLAAMTVLNKDICEFKNVRIEHVIENNFDMFGAVLVNKSDIKISTKINKEMFNKLICNID